MTDPNLLGIATTARIAGHPIHPMLVALPIGLLAATFVSDIAFWVTADAFWARAAFWALVASIVTAAFAAIAGFIDFFGNARIRALKDAWQHMIGNLIIVGLALVSFVIRLADPVGAVLPWGLLLSTVIVLLVVFTGWKGGELAYRHRVGMHPEGPRR